MAFADVAGADYCEFYVLFYCFQYLIKIISFFYLLPMTDSDLQPTSHIVILRVNFGNTKKKSGDDRKYILTQFCHIERSEISKRTAIPSRVGILHCVQDDNMED